MATDPYFDVKYIKRLDELITRDAEFDKWIEELPEMMIAARKDEALRNIIESAYMMYCLKYKKE
jgi:hypothetical protein